jgi:hypothetical protein
MKKIIRMFLVLFAFSVSLRADDSLLNNQDIVEMQKMGLGDKVIVAKINEVKAVNFNVELKELKGLKDNGVSSDVITAMIQRKSNEDKKEKSSGANEKTKQGAAIQANIEIKTLPEDVMLKNGDKWIKLYPITGSAHTAMLFVAMRKYQGFSDIKSNNRINNNSPSIRIKSNKSPLGCCYLVKPKIKKNMREIETGSDGFHGNGSPAPANEYVIPYDLKNENNDEFLITPKNILPPGEYGLLFLEEAPLLQKKYYLYDFGVDK